MTYRLIEQDPYVKKFAGDTVGKNDIIVGEELRTGDCYYDIAGQQHYIWLNGVWRNRICCGGGDVPPTDDSLLGGPGFLGVDFYLGGHP